MLCPERSVESATQGGAPAHHDVWCEVTWAVCGQDLQDVGLPHKKGIQVYGDLLHM